MTDPILMPSTRTVPAAAPTEEELALIDEDDEVLAPDTGEEADAEAGLSDGGVALLPNTDIEFEDPDHPEDEPDDDDDEAQP